MLRRGSAASAAVMPTISNPPNENMITAIAITNPEAVRHKTALLPQIGDAGLRPAAAADQQPGAEHDHADDRHHLDDGEPKLGFAVQAHVHQINQVDQHKEQRG